MLEEPGHEILGKQITVELKGSSLKPSTNQTDQGSQAKKINPALLRGTIPEPNTKSGRVELSEPDLNTQHVPRRRGQHMQADGSDIIPSQILLDNSNDGAHLAYYPTVLLSKGIVRGAQLHNYEGYHQPARICCPEQATTTSPAKRLKVTKRTFQGEFYRHLKSRAADTHTSLPHDQNYRYQLESTTTRVHRLAYLQSALAFTHF